MNKDFILEKDSCSQDTKILIISNKIKNLPTEKYQFSQNMKLSNSNEIILDKILYIADKGGKKIEISKKQKKRQITQTIKWESMEEEIKNIPDKLDIIKILHKLLEKNTLSQVEVISLPSDNSIFQESQYIPIIESSNLIESTYIPSHISEIITQQIKNKIAGYKYQDILKNKYNSVDFSTFIDVINLLITSQLQCFYCNNIVELLYQNVREPKQWSLERIDNTFGHIKTNVEIACLSCNLHRRTMYHERFIFTKKCVKIKKIN